MKKLLSVFIFSLVIFNTHAQINWVTSIETAKHMAQESNKLILLDFWAVWCGPCKEMDFAVWNKEGIQELTKQYVALKIDFDANRVLARDYNITSIPRTIILDPYGDVIEERIGFQAEGVIAAMLKGYPSDISKLNLSLQSYNVNKESPISNYEVGLTYQQYLKESTASARNSFLKKSNQYLSQAQKLAEKAGDKLISEKAMLTQIAGQQLIGQHKKVIKSLNGKLDIQSLEIDNQGYAYFLLFSSFNALGQADQANEYLTKLMDMPEAKYYLALAKKEKSEG